MKLKTFHSKKKLNWLKTITLTSLLLIGTSCSQEEELITNNTNTLASKSNNSVELTISNVVASTQQSTNPVTNAFDDDPGSRWSGQGTDVNFDIDLGTESIIDYINISYHKGDERKAYFNYYYSNDGNTWTGGNSKTSSGDTDNLEEFDLSNATARYLRINCKGTSSGTWNSILDIEVYGTQGDDIQEPEEPTTDTNTVTWKNWYLSVPINDGNGSTSIYYQDIETMDLSSEEQQYFSQNSDGSYSMFTKFTGYTTSGEKDLDSGSYCRTELREYYRGNQSTSDNWSMNSGTHIMESTLTVNSCGGDGRTYVGQIHGYKTGSLTNSPATVKVQWNNGDIRLEYYVAAGKDDDGEWTSSNDIVATIGEVDNEKFTIKIKIENGKLYLALICDAKGIKTGYEEHYDYDTNGYTYDNYFKTGNYFKWNDDYKETAEVTLHGVSTYHD